MADINKDAILEHNQKAFAKILEAYKTSPKTCVIHPTGSGKSILYQMLIRHIQQKDPRAKTLFVTSATITLDKFEKDLEKSGLLSEQTELCMYTDLVRIEQAEIKRRTREKGYSLIIWDEFHHGGGAETNKRLRSLMEAADENALQFGGSATPVRDSDHRDMAVLMFGGNIASEITIEEAMNRGILKVPHYLFCHYDVIEAAPRIIAESVMYPDSKAMNSLRKTAKQEVIRIGGMEGFFEKFLLYPEGRYFVFCKNYRHMQETIKKFRTEWLKGKKVKYYQVHYRQSRKTNCDQVAEFEKDKPGYLQMLFCVNMAIEGLHVEAEINGEIMLRNTKSFRVYVQMLGRILCADRDGGEGRAFVSRPQIIDMVDNGSHFLPRESTWNGKQIPEGENQLKWTGRFETKVAYRTLTETLICMRDIMWQRFTWKEVYEAARAFFEKEGHLRVPKDYIAIIGKRACRLGIWVNTQRTYYHCEGRRKLSDDRAIALQAIGMEWDYDPEFEEIYLLARQFYEENGHLQITRANCPAGYALDRWLIRIRKRYWGEYGDPLTAEQIQKLEDIGMIWDPKGKRRKLEDQIRAAEQYYSCFHHLFIPDYASYRKLKAACVSLKRLYNKGEKLTEDQRNRLEKIGIGKNISAVFQKRIQEIQAYRMHAGAFPDKGFLLNWLKNQNRRWNRGDMSKDEEEALTMIGYRFHQIRERKKHDPEEYYSAICKAREDDRQYVIRRNTMIGDLPVGEFVHSLKRKLAQKKLSYAEIQKWSKIGVICSGEMT